MTKEELQETYSQLSTQELLEIADKKFGYTELAIIVAIEEISKRNISEEDINLYKEGQIEKGKTFIHSNITYDLTFFQKNLFFFLWIPFLNTPFKFNFRDAGYILKLKQANYYSLFGFIFFMVIGFLSGSFNVPTMSLLGIWILSFLPVYAFDEFFNRKRQINRLRRKIYGHETL